MHITEEIKKFDKDVIKLASKYKAIQTPINFHEIQNKILKYNSNNKLKDLEIIGFSYKSKEESYQEYINKLKDLKIPRGIFKELYKNKINESINKLNLLENLSKESFSEASKKLYGYPDKNLIDKAYSLLDLPEIVDNEKMSAIKAKNLLEKYLKDLNLDWNINIKNLMGYALIKPSKKQVTLSSNHKFSESTIKRLAVHEIGTHGVRYLNGSLQPLKIFKNFPGYLATEEGLAAFNEELSGYMNNLTLKRYAGRVIAVDYAKDHNLIETFQYLTKYFTNIDAINIAMRVKRGLPNTESLGSYTKDHIYLQGFINVKEYVKKNPLKYLYYGKINMDYLKLIKKIEPELKKIKYHPILSITFDKKENLIKK